MIKVSIVSASRIEGVMEVRGLINIAGGEQGGAALLESNMILGVPVNTNKMEGVAKL